VQIVEQPCFLSGRQDAALYDSQDGRRYATHICHPESAQEFYKTLPCQRTFELFSAARDAAADEKLAANNTRA